jgi:hypothetical protein
MADRSIVALHSLKPGPRTLRLPRRCDVFDVITDQQIAVDVESIQWIAPAGPQTRVFHLKER